ncbi:Creatinase [Pigmentiphaga humi]|uniref:Creatinase n=1 Tax=Pigmentiphaga humi TaxID=2478468 RepID=A0A3P4B885_9BURK|nr:M24 family metallopeptidase [Pigmentiphaga humi]VCU71840.1 Creatinase [Pigmentiphaga humi]
MLEERLVFRISDTELERRWQAVRAQMKAHGIDVLVMQNSNEFKGGYIRWFTDVAAKFDGPSTVIFPVDEPMTFITSGARHGRRTPAPGSLYRGVGQVLTSPYSIADCNTDHIDGELAVEALSSVRHERIGLVGQGTMRYSFGAHIQRRLPGAEFVNASDLVDRLKAIKSEEEISLIRQSARLQDEVWLDVLNFIRPGLREYEITTHAYRQCQLRGSTDGLILSGSAPLGQAAVKGHRHLQNRVLRQGDQFTMLIEVNGMGGYYTELGRTCVLGKASTELLDEYGIAVAAQEATAARLTPGASPAGIWSEHNAYMRGRGRPEEARLFCHGQGYDLVERPTLRDDDTMLVAPDMNIVVHPTYATPSVYSWTCDNFLIRPHGAERLHETPQKIFELS